MVLVGMILLCTPFWVNAIGSGDRIQEQSRIQLKDRLYINDEAKIQL